MRPNQQNKNRSRGRNGGRKNVNPLSRNFESNGPDVKIRGNAAHIAERYVQLARDATASGDSVTAENYFQHAEHYFRILSAAQSQMPPRKDLNFDYDDDDGDGDETGASGGDGNDGVSQAESASGDDHDQGETEQTAVVAESETRSSRPRRPRRRRSGEDAENKSDPASAPQPDVPELPAFLTAGSANAAE
ncbi:MAG: DUF4167 domain-containing protein [Alphaproteobacteria bacterium]|nr:DUF4167 domain-containing protein [Alphaproteobacteria bacterium]